MSNIVIFGATQSGKTTLLGYLATAMFRHPQLNDEIFEKFKLIRKLSTKDEFSIGDPHNPINVNKDIILPSFVSLDKDELLKFRGGSTEGTTKRIHHQQLTICISECKDAFGKQNENENVSCTFLDLPGFRQKLSDKYRGFFEGDIGIAVLKLKELLELNRLLNSNSDEDREKIDKFERRLFEPLRIWCDYRSPKSIMIALSQIDLSLIGNSEEGKIKNQINDINNALNLINLYTKQFSRGIEIPVSPISIKIVSEKNTKKHYRMSVFFKRKEDNIYSEPESKLLPGSGTFISCLKKIMQISDGINLSNFSMASVYKPMKAIVNGSPKTALNVHSIHGTIHNSDELILGPVIDKDNNVVFAQCGLSSIKADGTKNPSDRLLEGNVGGLIFKSIKLQNSKHQYNLSYESDKSDLSLLKSTILFKEEILRGDVVELEIHKKYHITEDGNLDKIYSNILPSLMPFDELIIFWYGKKVTVNIVELELLEDKLLLSVIISKTERHCVEMFALPSVEGELKFKDNILIAVPRIYYTSRPKKDVQGMYTYVSSNIIGIKNSNEINHLRICSQSDFDLRAIFEDVNQSNEIKCYEEDNSYLLPIKKEHKSTDIYSQLTKIGRNTRRLISRKVYRQIGGLYIKLLKTDT